MYRAPTGHRNLISVEYWVYDVIDWKAKQTNLDKFQHIKYFRSVLPTIYFYKWSFPEHSHAHLLLTVCSYFCATIVELSSWDRNFMFQKPKVFTNWSLIKRLPTSTLDKNILVYVLLCVQKVKMINLNIREVWARYGFGRTLKLLLQDKLERKDIEEPGALKTTLKID